MVVEGVQYGKRKNEVTICSSTVEYLTLVAFTGDSVEIYKVRYEDENI